jgi:hypothetical protein
MLLALVPVLIMGRRVGQSTELNYQDYWPALMQITNADGSVHLRGFLSYVNEHPFVVPHVIFYLDTKLLDGTNRELGYFSLAMAVISLLLIWRLLPERWSLLGRALLLLGASAVLLCPAGAWNFVRGMSGTSWITANAFALAAILAARRSRTTWALVLAALSILSYGTGFGAPVAVLVVALLRRDSRWRWLLPLGMLLGALAVYKLTAHGGSTGTGLGHDPGLLAQTFLSNLATLWDPAAGSLGLLVGAGALVLTGFLAYAYWIDRQAYVDLIPWWGVVAYSLFAAALISVGRSEVFQGDGAQSRYVSLSALLWIALAVIGIRLVRSPRELAARVAVAAATVLLFWGASPSLFAVAVAQSPRQDEIAAGLRFGATDPFVAQIYQPQEQIKRLKALGSYPFTADYTVGCGLKPDDVVDLSKVQALPASLFPTNGAIDSDVVTGNTRRITGWVNRGGPAKCALVVDQSGKLVGGGTTAVNRTDVRAANPTAPLSSGFDVVTPASQTGAQLVLGFSDGLFTVPAAAKADASAPK